MTDCTDNNLNKGGEELGQTLASVRYCANGQEPKTALCLLCDRLLHAIEEAVDGTITRYREELPKLTDFLDKARKKGSFERTIFPKPDLVLNNLIRTCENLAQEEGQAVDGGDLLFLKEALYAIRVNTI